MKTIRRTRRATNAVLLYDIGDAQWLPQHGAGSFDLARALRECDIVTSDNLTSMHYASIADVPVRQWRPPSQVELFNDDSLLEKWNREKNIVTIGWVGSEGTSANLDLVAEALVRLGHTHAGKVRVCLLGIAPDHKVAQGLANLGVHAAKAYNQQDMAKALMSIDIGIYPRYDTDEARAHGILKGLVYMAGGCAVVASPIGDLAEVVPDETFLAASTPDDWYNSLERLVVHADERKALAIRGRQWVAANYSRDRTIQDLLDAVRAGQKARLQH